jgi:hypothetical protein
VLTGAEKSTLPRDLYFFDGQSGPENEQIAVTSANGWKLIIQGPEVRREGGYGTTSHRVELFHLAEDPLEKNDRAALRSDLVKELGKKAVAFRTSEPKESLRPINRKPSGFKPPPKWRNAPEAAAR